VTSSKKISVLLVEDHIVVRQSLSKLLETEGQCRVVGHARTGREAVNLAGSLRPDVILLDIALPVLNGFGATRQILAANPDAKVLVLSAHSENAFVERMTAAGAVGFLEKQNSAAIVIHAIHEVAQGKKFFSPAIAKRMAAVRNFSRDRHGLPKKGRTEITPREAEVLQLVAEGQSNKQAAATLSISMKTVEKHRQHLMNKLHIHDTAGLTRYAMVHGIIESSVHVKII
jgi:DNA-binding NarL/FixJ family response regulator